MKKSHIAIALATLVFSACGESLYDTYKDMAGDGEIRYIGMVSDMSVSPGWEHINVSWTNAKDPIIDRMEVKWNAEGVRDSVFLPAGTTAYDIANLTNGSNYEISVVSVDKDGNESQAVTSYTRPYNEDHEAVQSFTNVIVRSFFLKDHLLMTFLGTDPNLDSTYVTFTRKSDGQSCSFTITNAMMTSLHADVPDVDASQPVILHRRGRIEGCPDEIDFPEREVDKAKVFGSEFKTEMKRQFGFDNAIPDSWADGVTSLDLDWDIADLADLLNLPNLKTLYLGRGRYVREDMVNDATKSQSKVTDVALSNWVLEEMNKLTGLQVYRYDKHFSTLTKKSFITDEGHHAEPNHNFLNMTGATVDVDPADDDEAIAAGWDSHASFLIDGDATTSWRPYIMSEITTYSVTINLPRNQNARGLRLVQSYYPSTQTSDRALNPTAAIIYTSSDGVGFDLATYVDQTTLGASTGEVNYIPFTEEKNVKAVRIVVTTPKYINNYCVSLAEATLYD